MCASYNCEFIHLLYNVLFESIITTTKETPPIDGGVLKHVGEKWKHVKNTFGAYKVGSTK